MLFGVALAGCQSVYRSPGTEGLGESDLAIVELPSGNRELTVLQLDGARPGLGSINRFELASGPHTITLSPSSPKIQSGSQTLSFGVTKGQHYVLHFAVHSSYPILAAQGTWHAWIAETSTGRIVSSPQNVH